MNKIIFLSGVPGTGKSTYINNNFDLSKIHIISSDETRIKITGTYATILNDMSVVYNKMIEEANALLQNNQDITIVFDSTFLYDARRNYFLDNLKNYDYVELIMLKVSSLETILKRNKLRHKDKWVPEEFVRKSYEQYSYPSDDNVKRYNRIIEVFVD